MNIVKSLLGSIRVPFLILTPACVAVGVGTAYWQTQQLNFPHVFWVLVGALLAHISVNAFNEYFDFKSGLDTRTQKTPFSGGSGTLPSHPELERSALLLSVITLVIAAAIGGYFVWLQGWQLLPLGVFGLLLIVTYTIWWVYNPVLSLVAPGLGFGILMVMGTHFALTGTYTWSSFMASLTPTFLVSNLLLLNQFPDVEADMTVGRKHYPIKIGRKASSNLYGMFLVLAYLSIFIGVLLGVLPVLSLIALLSSILAWRVYKGVSQNADNPAELIPFMGQNVIINIVTPVLLAIGLFLG